MMATMDAEQARADLEQARRSYESAVHPALPPLVPPLCAVLVGGGTALVGTAAPNGWAWLVCTLGGALMVLAAVWIVLRVRTRHGVSGLRGPARESATAVVACGIAFLASAAAATAQTRWLYAGLGIVTGGYTWWSLARRRR